MTTPSCSQNTLKGIITDYDDDLIDGKTILRGDRLLVVEANGTYVPSIDSRVIIDGDEWNIVSIRKARPAAITICFFCQVRA